MTIYVYDNKDFENGLLFDLIKYTSEQVPRIGEYLHLPHFGGFKVKNVVYEISDDNDYNEVMWVGAYVEPLSKKKS